MLTRTWVERSLRIAVSKKNPQHRQIVESFDRTIEDMRQDGSYFAILAQFRLSSCSILPTRSNGALAAIEV